MEHTYSDKTIGILVGGILDDFTKSVCQGAAHQAQLHHVRVVSFPGKYINRDLSHQPELMYEYQFNTVFSCARPENIDALICAIGSIGSFTTKENILNMLEQYKGIPLILVGMKLEGYTCITYDNYSGIEEGIEQMFKNGCRSFGMITGNLSNSDVAERHQAFIRIMQNHQIPVTSSMFAAGDLSRRSSKAFCRLLDQNPNLDAVFCVNDDTALGFYEELKRRDLKPGHDVAVLGYDDTIAAAKANPPLSTVHADGSLLGEEALLTALELLEGKDTQGRIIPTRFVARDSIRTGQEQMVHTGQLIDAGQYFETIFYRYSHDQLQPALNTLRRLFTQMVDMLVQAYATDAAAALPDDFRLVMEQFLRQQPTRYADMSLLILSFEEVYRILYDLQPDERCRFHLRDTFAQIYRSLIHSMDQQIGEITQQEEQMNYSMKLFIRDMLQFEKGNDSSYASLLTNLDWMQIKNGLLYLFESPVTHLLGEDFVPPQQVCLKAVLKNGLSRPVPSLYQQISVADIFRTLSVEGIEGTSFVLFPLFYNETLYGLLLCDLTDALYNNGEFLVNQMSSATRMIHLLHMNEEIQKQLEESLSVLKENNIALETLSNSDALTDILNRRGFYHAAEAFLSQKRAEGLSVLVLYIDMNNLKIINDRYGHEEGDFSLNLIGSILQTVMSTNGIAGRIGGDEFACIFQSEDSSPDAVIPLICRQFDAFNASSDKPYNITVSIGSYILSPTDDISLEQAMTIADESLYEMKKLRRKEVAKLE